MSSRSLRPSAYATPFSVLAEAGCSRDHGELVLAPPDPVGDTRSARLRFSSDPWRISPTTMIMFICLALAGCTGRFKPAPMQDEVRQTVDQVEVHRLAFGAVFGTGVHIGDSRILTCRHVLVGNTVEVDGRFAIYETVASGAWDGEEDAEDDWAIIELTTLDLEAPSVMSLWHGEDDPGHSEVVFKTYFYTENVDHQAAYATPVTLMQGELAPSPFGDTSRLLYAEVDVPTTPAGGSGGPMFSYDPATGDVVLRGLYIHGANGEFLGFPTRVWLAACPTTGDLADALRTYGTYD